MRCYSCRKYDDCERPWKCDGTMYDCTAYELEQTNEEYLRSLNTEQLADVLLEHFEWGLSINAEYCFTEKYVEQNREHILEWLKQPHRGTK